MFIGNNPIANSLYVPYTKNLDNLAQSARRLSTGEKVPTASDGPGDAGIADALKGRRDASNRLIEGMSATLGVLKVQDEVTSQAGDMIVRMIELAGAALDTTKSTADRLALDMEFVALQTEFSDLAETRYNGISIFGVSLSLRLGIVVGDTKTYSTVTLAKITFGTLTLSQLTSANTAIVSLQSRLASFNGIRARVGVNVNSLQNIIDKSRLMVNAFSDSESQIRNIDLALSTGEFTRQQVIVAASQNVLAQANGLAQSVLTFLG